MAKKATTPEDGATVPVELVATTSEDVKLTSRLVADVLRERSDALRKQLAEPFSTLDVHWRAGEILQDRCLAIPYVNARTVQERLDDVLGIDGWRTNFQYVTNNDVMCVLECKINGEWIRRSDVGSPSAQMPNSADNQAKGAFSDALKRAAVQFGVGRYLYAMPSFWVKYDAKSRSFDIPTIPKRFLSERERSKLDQLPEDEKQVSAPVPGAGMPGQAIPPKQLGGENGEKPITPPPAQADQQWQLRHLVLWKSLTDDEKKGSKQLADLICAASSRSAILRFILKFRAECVARKFTPAQIEHIEEYSHACFDALPVAAQGEEIWPV